MNSLAAAALSKHPAVRQGGGRPQPQDTVPARIVPKAKTTQSREVVQPPKGSKPALLAPGEIVNDQKTSADVIGPMLEEFEKTGLVDGKPPGPRVLEFIKSLLPQGEAGERDADEEREGYGCGGKVMGFAEGGGVFDYLGDAENRIVDASVKNGMPGGVLQLGKEVGAPLLGLGKSLGGYAARTLLGTGESGDASTPSVSIPQKPTKPAARAAPMGTGNVAAPPPSMANKTDTTPSTKLMGTGNAAAPPQSRLENLVGNVPGTGNDEANGIYSFGNGSGVRLNSPEQNHAFVNNGGPFAGGDPTLTMGEALHNAAQNQRNPNIFTADNGGYASGQIGKGGTVSVLGGGAVPGGRPTLGQAANALDGGNMRFSAPEIERPSQWALDNATHNAAVDARSRRGTGPWKARLAALQERAKAADAQALQRQQLAAGLQGQNLQSQAVNALGMAQLGEQNRASQFKEGLLAKAAAGDTGALMALHGMGRQRGGRFKLQDITDPNAKPSDNPLAQQPKTAAIFDEDTGQYQMLGKGSGGQKQQQPKQIKGYTFVRFESGKNGVKWPIYKDKDGKEHLDDSQPF